MTATAKRIREPKTDIGVADQFTSRSAQAIAHRSWWGETEGEFSVTEMQVTVDVQYGVPEKWGVTPETVANVRGVVSTSGGGKYEQREFDIQHLQLGDLPLLVLALQEAILIGDEQDSFPILSPNAYEIADTIKARLKAKPARSARSAVKLA